jgi:hypothetical protein
MLPCALLTALLCACAPNVVVQQDPAAQLPGAASYRWGASLGALPGALPGSQDPQLDNDITRSTLKTALDQGLAQRGYHQDATSPAWLLSVSTGLQKQTRVVEEPIAPAGQMICDARGCFMLSAADVSTPRSVQVDENTIMVDLRDAHSGKLAWRGIIKREVNLKRDLQADRLQKAVDMLLEKLPAATGAGKQN